MLIWCGNIISKPHEQGCCSCNKQKWKKFTTRATKKKNILQEQSKRILSKNQLKNLLQFCSCNHILEHIFAHVTKNIDHQFSFWFDNTWAILRDFVKNYKKYARKIHKTQKHRYIKEFIQKETQLIDIIQKQLIKHRFDRETPYKYCLEDISNLTYREN